MGNICLQAFPPPVNETDITHAKAILRTGAILTTGLCFLTWIFAACGKHIGWMAWFVRSSLIWSIPIVVWIGAENAGRKVEKEIERIRMNMMTQRAESFSPPTPESVEWMNALLKLIWGLVNPDMFVPIVDVRPNPDYGREW